MLSFVEPEFTFLLSKHESKLKVADLTLCAVEVWGRCLEPDIEEVLTSDHTSLDVDSRSSGKDDLCIKISKMVIKVVFLFLK